MMRISDAPEWFMTQQHVTPKEAVQIHTDIGSKESVGMQLH